MSHAFIYTGMCDDFCFIAWPLLESCIKFCCIHSSWRNIWERPVWRHSLRNSATWV